jgi:hypothetical protein
LSGTSGGATNRLFETLARNISGVLSFVSQYGSGALARLIGVSIGEIINVSAGAKFDRDEYIKRAVIGAAIGFLCYSMPPGIGSVSHRLSKSDMLRGDVTVTVK